MNNETTAAEDIFAHGYEDGVRAAQDGFSHQPAAYAAAEWMATRKICGSTLRNAEEQIHRVRQAISLDGLAASAASVGGWLACLRAEGLITEADFQTLMAGLYEAIQDASARLTPKLTALELSSNGTR